MSLLHEAIIVEKYGLRLRQAKADVFAVSLELIRALQVTVYSRISQ